MSAPEFETITDARGQLVRCTIDGVTGAARVMSAGMEDARQRAELQARRLLDERDGPSE